MRKLLAILFLTLFSTFTFPVEQLGKYLFENNWSEEVQEHVTSSKRSMSEEDKLMHFSFNMFSNSAANDNPYRFYVLADEALIKCFHLAVPEQPPNFLF